MSCHAVSWVHHRWSTIDPIAPRPAKPTTIAIRAARLPELRKIATRLVASEIHRIHFVSSSIPWL